MHKGKVFLFVILFIIASFIPHIILGQLITTKSQQQKRGTQANQNLSLEERLSLEEKGFPVPTAQALETIINPDEYLVGPGDLFSINILGGEEMVFPAQVTPEGKLIIQTVGTLFVNKKPLSQVQKKVMEAGEKKYKVTKVTASLIQLRVFRVHVTGEVDNPGTFVAQAVDRASVLIDRAGGITDWADSRHIEIRHKNGSLDLLDVFKFKKLGLLEQNIYMQNGDVIYVPAIKLSEKTVTLEGYVTQPGIHQIVDGEMLSSFLLRVDAFNRRLDPHQIYVTRIDAKGENKIININLLEKNNSTNSALPNDIILENGDKIHVPSLKNRVYVHGAVFAPGSFSYNVGFRARDYVGLAGGTEEMGNIRGIRVIHFSDGSIGKGPNAYVERGDTVIVPRAFRRSLSEYLQIFTGLATLVFAFMAAQK
jgi:protein involved in polysaccharide export with SLBB domain